MENARRKYSSPCDANLCYGVFGKITGKTSLDILRRPLRRIRTPAENTTSSSMHWMNEIGNHKPLPYSKQFKDTFSSLTNSNTRILVTSRPYPEIEGYFKRVADKNLTSCLKREQDIVRYIEETVVHVAQGHSYTDKLKKQVSNLLREKAGGTLL